MISIAEARALVCRLVQPLPGVPTDLVKARGMVLREPVTAREDFPAFDRSAMDGYATGAVSQCYRLRVTGESRPGSMPEGEVRAGECFRIFTGAAVPEGTVRVIPQELVDAADGQVVICEVPRQEFIRRRGEDARKGAILLQAGTRLGAAELSLLAFAGITKPVVSARARVAHFATGDELVAPETTPAPGQIRDSNSVMVSALLGDCGAELKSQRRISDNAKDLRDAIEQVFGAGCDLLLISGGASVGDYDFGPRVLTEVGFTLHFRQLDLRPGKPLVFATRGAETAFVIPGNPVSHFVTFHTVIRHALDCLAGAQPNWPVTPVQLTSEIPAQRDQRAVCWPARLEPGVEGLRAQPLPWQSSGDLGGLVGANALLLIPGGSNGLPAGASVLALLIRN